MMKTARALGFVLALLAASGGVWAQSSIVGQIAGDKAASDKLNFGLRFGFDCSQLRGLGYGDRLGGFSFGLTARIKLGPKLFLSPELTLFSRKGATEIPFVTTGDPALDPYFADPAKSAIVLDYLEVPVRVLYRLGRFELGGGAFVGSLSSASERFRAELETGGELLHVRDAAADYRNVNYGFVLEAAWIITMPRRGEGLVFHVRYQGGLADIVKDPAAPGPVRTVGLQIFLSFPFIR
jgi:Outer membrane protein beta-barrel domain